MPACIPCSLFTLVLILLLTAHITAIHRYALCIKSDKKVYSFQVRQLWGERGVFIRVVFTNGMVKSWVFTLIVWVMHRVVWIVEERESYNVTINVYFSPCEVFTYKPIQPSNEIPPEVVKDHSCP